MYANKNKTKNSKARTVATKADSTKLSSTDSRYDAGDYEAVPASIRKIRDARNKELEEQNAIPAEEIIARQEAEIAELKRQAAAGSAPSTMADKYRNAIDDLEDHPTFKNPESMADFGDYEAVASTARFAAAERDPNQKVFRAKPSVATRKVASPSDLSPGDYEAVAAAARHAVSPDEYLAAKEAQSDNEEPAESVAQDTDSGYMTDAEAARASRQAPSREVPEYTAPAPAPADNEVHSEPYTPPMAAQSSAVSSSSDEVHSEPYTPPKAPQAPPAPVSAADYTVEEYVPPAQRNKYSDDGNYDVGGGPIYSPTSGKRIASFEDMAPGDYEAVADSSYDDSEMDLADGSYDFDKFLAGAPSLQTPRAPQPSPEESDWADLGPSVTEDIDDVDITDEQTRALTEAIAQETLNNQPGTQFEDIIDNVIAKVLERKKAEDAAKAAAQQPEQPEEQKTEQPEQKAEEKPAEQPADEKPAEQAEAQPTAEKQTAEEPQKAAPSEVIDPSTPIEDIPALIMAQLDSADGEANDDDIRKSIDAALIGKLTTGELTLDSVQSVRNKILDEIHEMQEEEARILAQLEGKPEKHPFDPDFLPADIAVEDIPDAVIAELDNIEGEVSDDEVKESIDKVMIAKLAKGELTLDDFQDARESIFDTLGIETAEEQAEETEPEPVEEAVEEPTEPEPVEEAVEEPTEPEPVEEVAEEPTEPEPVEETVEEPAEPEPLEETAEETTEPEPVEETVEESTEPAEETEPEPLEETAEEEPIQGPDVELSEAEEQTEESSEELIEEPVVEPVEEPIEETAEEPAEEATEESGEEPVEEETAQEQAPAENEHAQDQETPSEDEEEKEETIGIPVPKEPTVLEYDPYADVFVNPKDESEEPAEDEEDTDESAEEEDNAEEKADEESFDDEQPVDEDTVSTEEPVAETEESEESEELLETPLSAAAVLAMQDQTEEADESEEPADEEPVEETEEEPETEEVEEPAEETEPDQVEEVEEPVEEAEPEQVEETEETEEAEEENPEAEDVEEPVEEAEEETQPEQTEESEGADKPAEEPEKHDSVLDMQITFDDIFRNPFVNDFEPLETPEEPTEEATADETEETETESETEEEEPAPEEEESEPEEEPAPVEEESEQEESPAEEQTPVEEEPAQEESPAEEQTPVEKESEQEESPAEEQTPAEEETQPDEVSEEEPAPVDEEPAQEESPVEEPEAPDEYAEAKEKRHEDMQNALLMAMIDDKEKTFSDAVNYMIDQDELNARTLRTRMPIDKDTLDRVIKERDFIPDKKTALAICFALRLTWEDSIRLLYKAGYSLNDTERYDLTIEYLMRRGVYDQNMINSVLRGSGLEGFGTPQSEI